MIYNSWWIFGTLLVKHKIPIPYRDLTQLRERERERERERSISLGHVDPENFDATWIFHAIT